MKRLRIDGVAGGMSLSNSPTLSEPSLTAPSPAMAQMHLSHKPHVLSTPNFSPPSLPAHSAYQRYATSPSNSSAFSLTQSAEIATSGSPPMAGSGLTNLLHPPLPRPSPRHQIIDLTVSPSPPPSGSQTPQYPPSEAQHPQAQSPPTTLSVPPKTPVCIGQLTVMALVLYPVQYLHPQPHSGVASLNDVDWAPVRLYYDAAAKQQNPTAEETIHIKTPTMKLPSGETSPGNDFGVVEQKVALALGPMLGKGLIRLDAKVRRSEPNVRFMLNFHLHVLLSFPGSYQFFHFRYSFTHQMVIFLLWLATFSRMDFYWIIHQIYGIQAVFHNYYI